MLLRLPLIEVVKNHLVSYPTPLSLNYFWGFGSLAGLMLASQILTGILLAMHYCPNIDLAFASIEHIMRDVNNGWLLRYVHANGASFFFFVYVHIGRSFVYGLYTYSRRYLWFSGLVIFVLMMAIAFMGYVLPWGQMSFWGATVITNLFSAIPVIGESIALWLWGGFAVGNATLTRFFSFHYVLPFLLLGAVGLHLALLHQLGSTSPFGVLKNTDKINFYPYFYVKDYFGTLIALFIFLFFVVYNPDVLGHPDNYIEADALVTPTHIVPEWYFLPYYALLRSIPNKLGGVLVMALSLLVSFMLPFYQVSLRSTLRQSRLIYGILVWFFLITFVLLGFLGGQPIEEPYTFFSQVLAVFYFLFFFAIVMADYSLASHVYLRSLKVARLISYKVSRTRKMVFFGWWQPTKSKNPNRGHRRAARLPNGLKELNNIPKLKKSHFSNNWMWLSYKMGRYSFHWESLTNIFLTKYFKTFPKVKNSGDHPYHLVSYSPWPLSISFSLGSLLLGTMAFFHRFTASNMLMGLGFICLLYIMFSWFTDITKEGSFSGDHSDFVQIGLKYGMLLFILSEVLFFFAFFWGFFHSSLSPAIQIGGVWPPMGIVVFNPWDVPLLNTVILLTSGASVTWAHFAVREIAGQQAITRTREIFLFKPKTFFLIQFRRLFHKHPFFFMDFFTFDIFAQSMFYLYFSSILTLSRFMWRRNISRSLVRLNSVTRYFSVTFFCALFLLKVPSARLFMASRITDYFLVRRTRGGFVLYFINYLWHLGYNLVKSCRYPRQEVMFGFLLTIALGALFTLIQFYEYQHATYTIADSVYGSTFFLTTGFHGLHVLIGTLLLLVSMFRMQSYHFTRTHHVGMEASIWYWHFVDVVWLGLYISVYHWGGNSLV